MWHESVRDVNTWIVSYPKAGRTWLRFALACVLEQKFGVSRDLELTAPTRSLVAAGQIASVIGFTHDASSFHKCVESPTAIVGTPWSELTIDVEKYRSRRVVFLVRDPRDVAVSSFLQLTKRDRTVAFHGTRSEFLRDKRFGLRKIVRFHQLWQAARHIPEEFHVLRYEDLQCDFARTMSGLLTILGLPFDDAVLEAVRRESSFTEMFQLQFKTADGRLRPGRVDDPDTYKVRRGVVGGFRDYFCKRDLAEGERTLADCPYYRTHCPPEGLFGRTLKWLKSRTNRAASI